MNQELNAIQKMEALYNSEINVEISSFFDAGFTVKIGDTINGFKAESEIVYGFENAANEAWEMAKKIYPEAQAFHDPNPIPWDERNKETKA